MLDKDKIKIIKLNNSEYVVSIFLCYQPKDHLIAHLYEHLIYRELISIKGIDIKNCNVGSGVINIKFVTQKQYFNTDFLLSLLKLENLTKSNFDLEKKRLRNELSELFDNKFNFFYEAIQHHIFNDKKILNLIKKVARLKLDSVKKFEKLLFKDIIIVIMACPEFKKNIPLKINIKNKKLNFINPPKVIELGQKNKKSLVHNEISFRIVIKNNTEAHYLSLIANLLGKYLNQILIKEGVYKIKGNLYKDFDKKLYWGISFLNQKSESSILFKKIIGAIKDCTINKDDFLIEKREMLSVLKNIKNNKIKKTEDRVWQNLEWNNYVGIEKEINKIKDLGSFELKKWWNKKMNSAEMYKIF